MSECKLVPFPPTQEMVEAAEDAYMPFGDMELALRMAILAAPAVQGEPVAWIRKNGFRFIAEIEPQDDSEVPLYTAPQPAEQQPDRDVRMLAASLYQACGAYDMPTRVLDALSAAANGEPFAHMIDGLLPCVPPSNQDVQGDTVGAEQQPAPDVSALVEALERSVAGFDALSGMASLDSGARNYARQKAVELNGSLAAYRQKGGEA